MKILLIEDMAGFAQPIKEFLEAQGHVVTWIIGAFRLGGDRLTGILASPNADPLEDSWDGNPDRLLAVDLAGCELALVDGGLIGPINHGADIIPTLAKRGIVCVAISGGGAGNPPLLKAGARVSLPKELVILALSEGVFDPVAAAAAPDKAQAKLPAFIESIRARALAARNRGEKFDYGFPVVRQMD